MAKKTRKGTRELFEEDVFFDRDLQRNTFWERYALVKEEHDFQVIMYYGLGGMGKTSLLNQIEKEIEEHPDTIVWGYYDLNDGQDHIVVLRKIAKSLQEKYNFQFYTFLYAIYSYMIKCGEDAEAPEVKNILDEIPLLREAFKLANILPGVNTFSQPAEWLVDKIFGTVEHAKKQQLRGLIERINNASKDKLYEDIPQLFVNELNENLKKNQVSVFVLILDTYERLVNELSMIGTPIENDLWLRDDDKGILMRIDNLLCVFAGRERLKWRDIDSEWDETVLNQVEIDTFDEKNSLLLLESYKVTEVDIQEKILEVTQGMPLYLDVCIDTYRSAKEYGELITVDLFDNKIDRLAKRLLTYMTDEEKDVLYLLACLRRWTTVEYDAINDLLCRNRVSNKAYQKLLGLTFVRTEAEQFYMHQTMQEILVQYCSQEMIEIYIKAMYKYIEDKNIFSAEYMKYVYSISQICMLKSADNLIDWWIQKIIPSLEVFLDAFYLNQFENIYDILGSIVERYPRLKTLYLRYLLKKSDYEKSLQYINNFKSINARDLEEEDFWLTASYYFYINGQDKEALKLRERVFEVRKEILGLDNRETIYAGLALAASFSRMGKHTESIRLGDDCRKRLKSEGNIYDVILSASQNQLGDSYFRLGKFIQAKEIYTNVYNERCTWLGRKNNSTMIAYNHIADCLVNLGEYEEAQQIYQYVLTTRRNELFRDEYTYLVDGEEKKSTDHPDTIIVENNLAVCKIMLGLYDKALGLLKEVVAKRTVTLAENAPATMGALENLAICEFLLGNKQSAIRNIERVIRAFIEKIGETHYDTIIAKYHRALILENNDDIQELINLYGEHLRFNPTYEERIKSRQFIGYFSLGRYYE